jgi:hypothetical protein
MGSHVTKGGAEPGATDAHVLRIEDKGNSPILGRSRLEAAVGPSERTRATSGREHEDR